ncbi:MAG: hypothetical protein PHR39_03525 [Actinomycetota bacterium]|nr:hypothetical protein [Actinomycetota bacterium]
MEKNKDSKNEKALAKQNEALSNVNIYEQTEKYINEIGKQKIKIHWLIVMIAIMLTFLLSFMNEVSLFENLNRCFYSGCIFWIIAEIIDYILKN